MKKRISMLLALVFAFACVFAFASCGGDCETHRDADDDGKCDECAETFADGCDATHRDANDDGKCDIGGESFTDGCDATHRDANDDGKCDIGGEDFTDDCDFHADADDNGKCDKCDEAFDDGCNGHVDADDNGKCDKCDEAFEDGADMFVVKFMRVNGTAVSSYANGTVKVVKNAKFSDDNLAQIAAIVYHGIGIDTWYTDKEMTTPFDFNTTITSDMTLYGVPSSKAGLNVSYTFDEVTGALVFTGTGDMFKFQGVNDVPWLKNGNAAKIKTVVIGEGITSLADNMLASATNVKTITIPSTVKTIGESVFTGSGIAGLVIIPEGVETIERNAFYNSKVSAVVLPKSIKTIGFSAFENSDLASIYYNGSRADFSFEVAQSNFKFNAAVANYYMEDCPPNPGPYWYYNNGVPTSWCYALKYYIGDSTVPEWIDYVFVSGAKATKNNINFREQLSKNGYQFQKIEPALELNTAITKDTDFRCYRGNIYSSDGNIYSEYKDGKLSINISDPDGITETWDILSKEDVAIFAEGTNNATPMSSVTSLEIAQGITYIGKYMFAGMTNVEQVIIPASVTAIHADAFDGCAKLKTIYYGGTNNLQIVNDNGKVIGTLTNCGATVYTKVLVAEDEPGNWYKIYETEVEGETVESYLAWTITADGVLYVGGSAEMVDFESAADAPWYIVKDSLKALVVLDGITSLGENMVNGYEGIETVTLPASVKDIPDSALAGTGYILNKAQ